MDLFSQSGLDASGIPIPDPTSPLAVRMRPRSLDEVVGQDHVLGPGTPLRRLIDRSDTSASVASVSSVIVWGPPGTGKTTLAYLIARSSERRFAEISAVSSGVAELRTVVSEARRHLAASGEETILFVDEVHRFSRTQQDALLPAVENRWVTLIAATTENPSFSVVAPLLSRSLLITLHALGPEDISAVLTRALESPDGLDNHYFLSDDAAAHIIRLAGADARKALTILEAAAGATEADTPGDAGEGEDRAPAEITVEDVERAIDVAAIRYDRAGDQHYDVTSAFIKSMRGSDPDAALHYLARMIVAGEDPRFIARRIIICAAEDVGMADPSALRTAVAAAQAVAMIGMPEGRIPLAEAVVAVATAPKSNAAYRAIDRAIADVKAGKGESIPVHLRDAHYSGAKKLGHGTGYKYAHDYPHAVARQQYLPDDLLDALYYEPTDRGREANITSRLAVLKQILGKEN